MRKVRESGNAEGAEMRKAWESGKAECDRIVGRWMKGRVTERQTDGRKEGRTKGRKEGRTEGRKDGMYCAGVKDLASAYVLCPRLTEQCVSFYFGRVTEVEDGRSAEGRNKYGKME